MSVAATSSATAILETSSSATAILETSAPAKAIVHAYGRATLAKVGVALTLGVLSACGFQLRGAADMPYKALYTTFAETSALGSEFKRSYQQQGEARIVDRADRGDARLEILGEAREKEIVAFSSTGRPREYQLRLKLTYRLLDAKSNEVIPASEITLRRDIITTDSQLVAKQQEEVLLYREMQSDMVQQLIRRLAAVKPR